MPFTCNICLVLDKNTEKKLKKAKSTLFFTIISQSQRPTSAKQDLMLASEYPPCHTQSFDFYHAVFVWLLKKVFSTEMVEKDEVASKQTLGRHPFSIKIRSLSKKHPLHAPIQLVLHQIISQTSYLFFIFH